MRDTPPIPSTPPFAAVAAEHRAAIHRLALRLTGSAADADDVTQSTFLLACKAWDRFEARSRVRTWLFRIAIREAGHLLRRRGVAPAAMERDPAGPDVTSEGVESSEEVRRIETALASLAPAHRLVLTLCCVEGLPAREAAEAMGCPEGTVWSRLHHARKALAAKLAGGTP